MSGYITFWSKEYVRQLEKKKDTGPICVVYGSHHLKMPAVSSLKVGDVIYPVAIKDKTLCVMARLPIEKIEPRLIPIETVRTMLFGKTKASKKPLKTDKDGNLTSTSLSGFVRKMNDETFKIFENMF